MTNLLKDCEVKIATINSDQLVLKLKQEHYILDYSLLMDLILELTQAAAIMENIDQNKLLMPGNHTWH